MDWRSADGNGAAVSRESYMWASASSTHTSMCTSGLLMRHCLSKAWKCMLTSDGLRLSANAALEFILSRAWCVFEHWHLQRKLVCVCCISLHPRLRGSSGEARTWMSCAEQMCTFGSIGCDPLESNCWIYLQWVWGSSCSPDGPILPGKWLLGRELCCCFFAREKRALVRCLRLSM